MASRDDEDVELGALGNSMDSTPTSGITDDSNTEFDDDPPVVEEQKKIEQTSIITLVTTLLTVICLIFGGAGAFYGIEGKHEENITGEIVQWRYLNCVYFCVVTLTTIGYGDITPKTTGGRVFVVIYAVISLGAMAGAITSIGKVIVLRANKQKKELLKVSKRFSKRIRKLTKMKGEPSEQDLKDTMKKEMEAAKKKSKNQLIKWVLRLVGMLLLIAVTIFVGARVFVEFEGWRYGNAVYYCFITLLTIGYGDFYPKTDNGKIFFIFYVFIGLGLLAFVVGDIGEKILARTQAQMQEAKLNKLLKIRISKLPKMPISLPFRGKKGKKDANKPKEEDKAGASNGVVIDVVDP